MLFPIGGIIRHIAVALESKDLCEIQVQAREQGRTEAAFEGVPAANDRKVVRNLAHRGFAATAEGGIERIGPGVGEQHGLRQARRAVP